MFDIIVTGGTGKEWRWVGEKWLSTYLASLDGFGKLLLAGLLVDFALLEQVLGTSTSCGVGTVRWKKETVR